MNRNFEEFVKASMKDVQVDYNPSHWNRIEQELDNKRGNLNYYIGGGIVAGILVTGALLIPFTRENQPSTSKNTVQVAKKDQPTTITSAAKTTELFTQNQPSLNPVKTVASKTIVSIDRIPGISSTSSLEPKADKQPELITKKVSEGSITAQIKVNRTVGCAGEAFYFAVETKTPATLEWIFGDGKKSNLPNPTHVFAPGKYGVSLKVTSLIDGKTLNIIDGCSITVNPKPVASFDYNMDETTDFSRTIGLVDQTKNSNYSEWYIDGKVYREANPKVKWNRKGHLPVALIVKNDLGCYDTLAQQITMNQEYNLLAPSAFTPNDDNQNDDFLPAALKNTEMGFKMEILDPRTGGIIFTSTKQPWDGQNNTTGKRADQGTYIWVVTLTRPDNSKEIFKGNLSLLK